MKISDAILAESLPLPPIGGAMFQYVVAGNGLFIRAEDSRLEACVPIASATLNGPEMIEPYARLKIERVSGVWLKAVLKSAREHLPNEAMYQFWFDRSNGGIWRVFRPPQTPSATAVMYDDLGQTVIDLHSHNSMAAFFSVTDDADEQGLRFYAVIGHIDTPQPDIRVRVGVYGHFVDVDATTVFAELGPFTDLFGTEERECRVCGCTDVDGCEGGCYWVEDDLCSNCVVTQHVDRMSSLLYANQFTDLD